MACKATNSRAAPVATISTCRKQSLELRLGHLELSSATAEIGNMQPQESSSSLQQGQDPSEELRLTTVATSSQEWPICDIVSNKTVDGEMH